MNKFSTALGKIESLLFPDQCVHCGAYGSILCAEGIAQYANIVEPFPHVISFFPYKENPIKYILHLIKYKNKPKHLEILAHTIAEYIYDIYVEKSLSQNISIHLIPTPMHAKKLSRRGYNQAEILCEYVQYILLRTHNINASVHTRVIVRIKDIQISLLSHKKDRMSFIKDSFKIIAGAHQFRESNIVFLVDDIVTTGATLGEIKKVLADNQIHVYECLAIAH